MMDTENEQIAPAAADSAPLESEVDPMEILYRLVERWKLIAVGALIGAAVMFIYSFLLATPKYEAVSKLYVLNSSDSAVNLADLQIGSYLASDYIKVFDTWEVNEMVRQNLQLRYTDEELKGMVAVENPANTRILYISVLSSSPDEAAAMANEYAAVARRYISSIMQTDEPSVLSEARAPEEAVSPRKGRNLALGVVLGAVVVCAALVLQMLLDDKIKTEEDIRRYTGLSTLAVVPDNDESARKPRERRTTGGAGRNPSRRNSI